MKKTLSYITNIYKSDIYSSFLLAFNQGSVVTVFLGIDYIFSKKLNIDEFGVWKKFLFFLNFLIPLISLGIPEGYKYYLAREGGKKILFSNTLILYLCISLMIFIGISVVNIAFLSEKFKSNNFSYVSYLIPICFFSFVVNKTLRYTSINENQIFDYTKKTLLSITISMSILACIYWDIIEINKNYNLIGAGIFILTYLLPSIILTSKNKNIFYYKWLTKDFIYKITKQGFPLYLATFIGSLTTNLGLLIVQIFENTKTFAIFSVGAFEIPIFAMLSASFSQKIYPNLVKLMTNEKNDEAKKLWINTTNKVSYITYPMIAILMFFSKEIIYVIYKQDYSQSVPIFKTFLLIGLFRNNYYGALITASGKSSIIFKYSIITLVLNSILSLIFYFFFGIKGIVYGNLIATITINYLQLKSEKLIDLYLNEFLLNPKIILLISIIIGVYVIR